ncbi:MAG: PH domain-containing protein [Candidatus Woesebacteria bacterium]|jgi:hypothetical protein
MKDVYKAKSKSSKPKKTLKNYRFAKKVLKKDHSVDHRPMASYRFYPHKAEFFNKDPEEKVILLLRRHPVTNIPWIAVSFLLLVAPSFITVLPFFALLPEGFQIIFLIVWYMLSLSFVFEKFLGWFYHVNIITDERIFDIDFIDLTHREITDAEIEQIQDVTVDVTSPLRTVFNYGDIIIQTAAQIPQVEFEAVPEPDKVARILRELRVEEQVEKLEGRIR